MSREGGGGLKSKDHFTSSDMPQSDSIILPSFNSISLFFFHRGVDEDIMLDENASEYTFVVF